jgi:hypothetical protein
MGYFFVQNVRHVEYVRYATGVRVSLHDAIAGCLRGFAIAHQRPEEGLKRSLANRTVLGRFFDATNPSDRATGNGLRATERVEISRFGRPLVRSINSIGMPAFAQNPWTSSLLYISGFVVSSCDCLSQLNGRFR